MKATFFVLGEADFFNNRIFSDLPINGVKNYGYMFAALRQQLAAHGIDLATQDIHPPEESELIIALDEVAFLQTYKRKPGQLIYLMINEPDTYFPQVWNKENHGGFDRVFSYDYTLGDGEKYIHHYFAIDLDSYPPFQTVTEEEFKRRKLLVLMAAMFEPAKLPKNSKSLLYKRYCSLRWFGQHWPNDFDFFSRGVDILTYSTFRGAGVLKRVLPKFLNHSIVNTVIARRRRFFNRVNKGPVAPNEKLTVIRRYRFVICYENTSSPGYISEKMFDCLFAGCVPVYLGEPNIARFVPAECFVDRKQFNTDAELADFLRRMTYAEYMTYIQAIEKFINGIERQKFGSEENAQRVSEVILADLAARV